jgi:hypothetical protein
VIVWCALVGNHERVPEVLVYSGDSVESISMSSTYYIILYCLIN